jgi:hypothetical protein
MRMIGLAETTDFVSQIINQLAASIRFPNSSWTRWH